MEKEQLVLIKNYNKFVDYVYNPIINTNRKHKILRDKVLDLILEQYKLFHIAIKSNQISRLYEADAGISIIRDSLRLLNHRRGDRRSLSSKQQAVAEILLSECGKIIGKMIINKRK